MTPGELFEAAVLPLVEKPSRYLGNEWNSVHKEAEPIHLRIVLIFPDLYDLGLGNLGLQILYHILNREPDVWAERAYAPGLDAEAEMRRRGIPLLSLESRTPLSSFDAVGFTLQSELTYTNILNLLDLGGIPLFATERTEAHPIILAGGPCVFNPEPLADFIDAFVIGDGEEVILEIAEVLRKKGERSREETLEALAGIGGVYVPTCYPSLVPSADGTLVAPPGAPPIVKRNVADLDPVAFPTDYIVPYTKQIHDRISLEVLRGCTQSCRFCQAGMVTRPVRERSLENLDALMQETLNKTGYEDLALVSLSTCDYSRVKSLVQQSVTRAILQRVGVGLPSLRLDSFSVELADMASAFKKGGITFAPEAATDRLRAVINKFIPDDELLHMAEECYRRGWPLIKLYFMMGLPTERDEDVLAIADLVRRVLDRGRRVNPRARLSLSVSTFVPKPHTPFQWDAQIDLGEAERKQRLLKKHLPRHVKWSRHDPRESFLEGVISRGDRRVGRLLYEGFRLGCKFDAWREHLNWPAWKQAFDRWGESLGIVPERMLRARRLDEPLPWDHIDILVSKEWLKADYKRSRLMIWHGDCRHVKCDQCGVIDRERDQCLTMLRRSHKESKQDGGLTWDVPKFEEPPPAQRLRFRYLKEGTARYLSGLEERSALERSLRRAKLPMSHSQGFTPQPRLALLDPIPTGYESECQYGDLWLTQPIDPEDFRRRVNALLPEGLTIAEAEEVSTQTASLNEQYQGAVYRLVFPALWLSEGLEALTARIERVLARDTILVARQGKKGRRRSVDIRPAIERFEILKCTQRALVAELQLRERGNITARVKEVLGTLMDRGHPALPYIRVRRISVLGLTS